jgi:hypothetical protein
MYPIIHSEIYLKEKIVPTPEETRKNTMAISDKSKVSTQTK